jgi:SAM-dependent methyltransferase
MAAVSTGRTSGRAEPHWEPAVDLNRRNTALNRALAELEGRNGRVLEAGAGTARFLRAIRIQIPGVEGFACDAAAAGLHKAIRADERLAVAQGDLTALPYRSESFDAVLVFDVLEHLIEPERAVREIARVLRPGGLFHALVPCEGQPGSLHWLMWKTNLGADLKEKRVGHVQRFTHDSLRRLLQKAGLQTTSVSYSMHWIGQVRDILAHAEEGEGFPRWLARNPLYRGVLGGLWAAAYLEALAFSHLEPGAVAAHVTATKLA